MLRHGLGIAMVLVLGCSGSGEPGSADAGGAASSDSGTDTETDASPRGDASAACSALPASSNTDPGALRIGIDEVVDGEVYVVYSGGNDDGRLVATSNIYVLRGVDDGDQTHVWLVGSGYGDRVDAEQYRDPNKLPARDAVDDVGDVDHVITSCLGLSRERVRVHFVAPHVHLDHLNQEFLTALFDAYSYSRDTAQLLVHENGLARILACEATNDYCCGDPTCGPSSPFWAVPFSPAWTNETTAAFETIGASADTCGANLMDFASRIGTWSIRRGNVHTSDTVDLVNTTARLWLGGANLPPQVNDCPADQTFTYLPIHGLVIP